jgi:hypothetical protein
MCIASKIGSAGGAGQFGDRRVRKPRNRAAESGRSPASTHNKKPRNGCNPLRGLKSEGGETRTLRSRTVDISAGRGLGWSVARATLVHICGWQTIPLS